MPWLWSRRSTQHTEHCAKCGQRETAETESNIRLLSLELCPVIHSGTGYSQDRLACRDNWMPLLYCGNQSPQLSRHRQAQFLYYWGRLSDPSECRGLLLLQGSHTVYTSVTGILSACYHVFCNNAQEINQRAIVAGLLKKGDFHKSHATE